MQIIRQNIYENVSNAVKYNDEILLQEVLSDEIAKLVVFNKTGVTEALRKSEVQLPSHLNNNLIAKEVAKNVKSNKKLRNEIICMVFSHNPAKEIQTTMFNANGRTSTKGISEEQSRYYKLLDTAFLNASGDESQIDSKVEAHQNSRNKVEKNGNKDVRKIIIKTAVVTTIAVVGVYFIMRYFLNKQNKMQDGGMVNDGSEYKEPVVDVNKPVSEQPQFQQVQQPTVQQPQVNVPNNNMQGNVASE